MQQVRAFHAMGIREKRLVRAARSAQRHAHAPYSKFRVGAALLARSGKVYTGCNIESSSFGLTICAERTALFKAISEGEHEFTAIAIAAGNRGETPPCGACRQVLLDLAGNIDVILPGTGSRPSILKLKELLPRAFSQKNLAKKKRQLP
jgi:cytidine deaminase